MKRNDSYKTEVESGETLNGIPYESLNEALSSAVNHPDGSLYPNIRLNIQPGNPDPAPESNDPFYLYL